MFKQKNETLSMWIKLTKVEVRKLKKIMRDCDCKNKKEAIKFLIKVAYTGK